MEWYVLRLETTPFVNMYYLISSYLILGFLVSFRRKHILTVKLFAEGIHSCVKVFVAADADYNYYYYYLMSANVLSNLFEDRYTRSLIKRTSAVKI